MCFGKTSCGLLNLPKTDLCRGGVLFLPTTGVCTSGCQESRRTSGEQLKVRTGIGGFKRTQRKGEKISTRKSAPKPVRSGEKWLSGMVTCAQCLSQKADPRLLLPEAEPREVFPPPRECTCCPLGSFWPRRWKKRLYSMAVENNDKVTEATRLLPSYDKTHSV